MSVVINEFEVVPAPSEPPPPREQEPAAPGADAQLEVERAVAARRDRDARLRAD